MDTIKLFKELINREFKNENIIYNYNEENEQYEAIINNSTFTLIPTINWKQLKYNINKKLQSPNNIECKVCYNRVKKYTRCSKCAFFYCIECYIRIFKHNRGLIKCPQCRYTYGTTMNELQLYLGELDIRAKY